MDGSRELVAAILRDNWLMRETLWLWLRTLRLLRRLYAMSALVGPMRTLSFLFAWDSLVVREQTAVVTSSRYAKMIDEDALTTD